MKINRQTAIYESISQAVHVFSTQQTAHHTVLGWGEHAARCSLQQSSGENCKLLTLQGYILPSAICGLNLMLCSVARLREQ